MGRKCIVPNCTSGYKSNNEKVPLFSIPKNSLKEYRRIIARKDRVLTEKDHVCAKHFQPECIIHVVKTELWTYPLRIPKLQEGSVPTIFPNGPQNMSKNLPQKREIEKHHGTQIERRRLNAEAKTVQNADAVSMEEMVCRLCLQTIRDNNCQPVVEPLLKFLKLNINICKRNVMCIDCASCLQVFSNFLPSCVYAGDRTLPLSDIENGVKLEPEAIETKTNQKSFVETDIKCSFCTHTHNREDLMSLKESKKNKFLVNMLEQYISDTLLNNTDELLTCGTCLKALQRGLNVISKCLKVEEKISKYIELVGADDKGQVELKDVQQFMFRPKIKLDIESFGANELKDECVQIQGEYTETAETEIKDEKELSNTELIIKTEDDVTAEQSDCDIPHIKSEQSDCNGFQESSVENETPNNPLDISAVTSEIRKSKDRIKYLSTHDSLSEMETLKCEFCSYETKLKSYLISQLLTHKRPSEIKMIKCELCSSETKQEYQPNRHLLVHKDPSENKLFKCELCSYETRWKGCLKRHLLTHKSPSEIEMFKCELCLFETKVKYQLKRHLLIHKDPSENKLFKCELCSYDSRWKGALKRHLLTHKSVSKIKMFKCELCSYETKLKSHLKSHLVTHKNPSEIKMFKCEFCTYEARHNNILKKHLLTHKSPSEIEMFKCELCPYEAKFKSHLKSHSLTHKSPSEIKMFKCELCSFETKQNYQLNRHLLRHKDKTEKSA